MRMSHAELRDQMTLPRMREAESALIAELERKSGRPMTPVWRDMNFVVMNFWLAEIFPVTVLPTDETRSLAALFRSHWKKHQRCPTPGEVRTLSLMIGVPLTEGVTQ